MENPFDPGFYNSEELRGFGFAHVGVNVRIARNCVIIGLEHISLGDDVRIDAGVHIISSGGKVRLHGRNHIGGNSHISAGADFELGEFSGFSQGVRVYTGDDDYSGRKLVGPCVPSHLRGVTLAPVAIGRHCVVGSGSVILPGCTFGEGSRLGALSLAKHTLEPWTLYAGCPARAIGPVAKDALHLEKMVAGLPNERAA